MTSTERLNQQLRDSIAIENGEIPNPRGLPSYLVSHIVSAYYCPMCLGHADINLVCRDCGYDAFPWIQQSKAKHDRALE
jgi:hypothetical protein